MAALDVIGGSPSDSNSNDNTSIPTKIEGTTLNLDRVSVLVGSTTESDLKSVIKCEEEDNQEPPQLTREEPVANFEDNNVMPENEQVDALNTIMISPEDLEEAGLDMDNLNELTEEQLNTLMIIAERRQRAPGITEEEVEPEPSSQHDESFAVSGDSVESNSALNNDAITMIITDDGSLKLTDASNQNFFFSHEQLAEMSIDVNNLTDESIQQIVQMAMPVINVDSKGISRPKSNDEVIFDHSMDLMQPSSSSGIKQEVLRASQLIGEQVEIRKEGRPVVATIRYVRNGGSYKVQFEDGHFEWITDEQITLRGTRRSDHESYHNDSTVPNPRVIHSSALQNCVKRAALAESSPTAVKRPHLEPNFCCPICENKVHQKEPAYIVIRIPACDACTREKIIVLDDQDDRGRGGGNGIM
ncbi:unnamed protein product [Auanema sp. JU1783]|nr:unnamed protein product [Auanema sp. JU1783]